tara:strand:+ start:3163 stop:3306 length:144 start_codon:yes stop_codon:yes gene_type:complete
LKLIKPKKILSNPSEGHLQVEVAMGDYRHFLKKQTLTGLYERLFKIF